MPSPAFLDVATFKAWNRDETTASDDLIQDSLDAAFGALNNALKRPMVLAVSGAEGLATRVYTPMNSDVLFIDDCTEVTAVVENGTTLTVDTDYQLEPLNALSDSGESWPHYRIVRHDRCWYTDGRKATVSVTLRPGWPAIPAQVVESVKIIARDMVASPDMRFGLAAITDAGGVGTRENRIVNDTIAHYRYAVRTFGIA